MNLIDKARRIATEAHAGQVRKYSPPGVIHPYIQHPERVAAKVQNGGFGTSIILKYEIIIAAAWLHDVFEDCDPKYKSEVANECGASVFVLVHELTNPSKEIGSPRALRKEIDRVHLSKVSEHAIVIKLADRTDNLEDMLGADGDFKRLYVAETKLLISRISYRPYYLFDKLETALKNLEDSLEKPK